MKKLFCLLLLAALLTACGSDTTTSSPSPQMTSVYHELSAHAAALPPATTASTEVQKMSVIKLFQAMFNATPGADLLNLCSGWLAGGMTESELANMIAGTELFKSASFYPDSLSSLDFSRNHLNNLLGSTVSDANKAALAAQMATFLDSGWKRGDLIWLLVSALSNLNSDPTWGSAAIQLNNRLTVSYYYSVTKSVASPDLSITASVTSDVATVASAKANIDTAASGPTTDGSLAGIYAGTMTGGSTTTFAATVSNDGIITLPGPNGNITALVNLATGDYSMVTSMPDEYNVNVPMTITGHIDAATGAFTATTSMVDSRGRTWSGTLSGAKAGSFTTAMLSGKTFNGVAFSGQSDTTTSFVITFNADKTLTSNVLQNGSTWDITATGQLLLNMNLIGHAAETDTLTLVSATPSVLLANATWVTADHTDGGSGVTFTFTQQ